MTSLTDQTVFRYAGIVGVAEANLYINDLHNIHVAVA